jgi:hypothetical protein
MRIKKCKYYTLIQIHFGLYKFLFFTKKDTLSYQRVINDVCLQMN